MIGFLLNYLTGRKSKPLSPLKDVYRYQEGLRSKHLKEEKRVRNAISQGTLVRQTIEHRSRDVRQKFLSGRVDHLGIPDYQQGQSIQLSEGWRAWLSSLSNRKENCFFVTASPRSTLPEHRHVANFETVIVIRGALIDTTNGQLIGSVEYDPDIYHTEPYVIPKNQIHGFTVISEEPCFMLVYFRPPLEIGP